MLAAPAGIVPVSRTIDGACAQIAEGGRRQVLEPRRDRCVPSKRTIDAVEKHVAPARRSGGRARRRRQPHATAARRRTPRASSAARPDRRRRRSETSSSAKHARSTCVLPISCARRRGRRDQQQQRQRRDQNTRVSSRRDLRRRGRDGCRVRADIASRCRSAAPARSRCRASSTRPALKYAHASASSVKMSCRSAAAVFGDRDRFVDVAIVIGEEARQVLRLRRVDAPSGFGQRVLALGFVVAAESLEADRRCARRDPASATSRAGPAAASSAPRDRLPPRSPARNPITANG